MIFTNKNDFYDFITFPYSIPYRTNKAHNEQIILTCTSSITFGFMAQMKSDKMHVMRNIFLNWPSWGKQGLMDP